MPTVAEYAPAVTTHPTRAALGAAAAEHAADVLRTRLDRPGIARVMLAAAPSQQETLSALARAKGIDWSRVVAFHMDDYLGLPDDAPQGFGNWLERHFATRVRGIRFERLRTAGDPEAEAHRYAALMGREPFDLVLLGLGVNGHLAFNDPPADLDDPRAARVVELDDVSRRQQVDEGHFPSIGDVPRRAITITIPRLLHATEIIASVPGTEKRRAVADTLGSEIHGDRPGTALRTHPRVAIYLDTESAPENDGS
ncbi:6-phosphogluconolactonase [Myceligenerans pegani]|uniref:6-phosphogluconolactonase n=1 Tax=Myceligenerans pegani TaxID=2776917 RepID=A0ABR9N003_9MICO|nr:6-phosphogluconolactonase [Myceligenerans sp. TRM 65318]MBE1876576.1 6-phosphogluconolactonase [Myceligenerans sp. TRM 65318]MBE3018847.1 6-phosphogluconolactonase [Myceligenerans sp. TRM 65318]